MAVESGWHRQFKEAVANYLSGLGYKAAAEHTIWIGWAKRRADIALPEHRIAIELWTSKYGPRRQRAEERWADLLAAGWVVLNVTASDGRACLMYVKKDIERLADVQASADSPAQIVEEKGLPSSCYERSRRYIELHNLYWPVENEEGNKK
jgi:hypothetical protein